MKIGACVTKSKHDIPKGVRILRSMRIFIFLCVWAWPLLAIGASVDESKILGTWEWVYYASSPDKKTPMNKKKSQTTIFKPGGVMEMTAPQGMMKGTYELKSDIISYSMDGAPAKFDQTFKVHMLSETEMEFEFVNSNNQGVYGLKKQ